MSSTYSAHAAQFPVWASRSARSSSESSPSSRSDAHSRERSHICGLSRNMSLEVTDGLVREELAELQTLKQAVPRIGQNAEDDEQRTERDEHEREVDRLPLLGSGGPACGAAAQEAHPRVALDACGATVPCEEAHDQDDRADAIEPERDRAADAGTEQEPERERHERGAGGDDNDQEHEAARCREQQRRPRRLGRHVAQDEEAAAAGGSLIGGAVASRISSAVSGQRSSGEWHAAEWLPPKSYSGGVTTSQWPAWNRGQRGWNQHADGGFNGLGTSPSSTMLARWRPSCGSGIGTAESSAPVYGCFGSR